MKTFRPQINAPLPASPAQDGGALSAPYIMDNEPLYKRVIFYGDDVDVTKYIDINQICGHIERLRFLPPKQPKKGNIKSWGENVFYKRVLPNGEVLFTELYPYQQNENGA